MNCKKRYELPDVEIQKLSYADVMLGSITPFGMFDDNRFDNPASITDIFGGGGS